MATTAKKSKEAGTLFTKNNHKLIAIGGAIVAIGYLCMLGSPSKPTEFDTSVVYSTLSITIAPVLVIIGIGVLVYGIMKKAS